MPGLNRAGHPGQILVLFAIGLPALLGMVGLAIDGGLWFARHQRVRAVADLAALNGAYCLLYPSKEHCAAAQSLGGGDAGRGMAIATAAVNGYVHGTGGATVAVTKPTASSVRVEVSTTSPTVFLQVVGLSSLTAPATAEAGIAGLSLDQDLAPLAACGNFMLRRISQPVNPATQIANGNVDDILLGSGTSGDPYRISPTYYNVTYVLQSSQLSSAQPASECPVGSGQADWKGVLDNGNNAANDPAFNLSTGYMDVPLVSGNARADAPGACANTGQGVPTLNPPSPCSLWVPVAIAGASTNYARIVMVACFEILDGPTGTLIWLGILRDHTLPGYCDFGAYTPSLPSSSVLPRIVSLFS